MTEATISTRWDFDKCARGHRVVPFRYWHLEVMSSDALQFGIAAGMADYKSYVLGMTRMGPAFTAFDSTGAVCIFGCAVPWLGLGEAWLIADREKIKRHPRTTLETGRYFVENSCNVLKLRRIQMYVRSSEMIFVQYAKAIHLEQETVNPLRKYGPDGGDYHIFARVTDGRDHFRAIRRRTESANSSPD